MAILTMISQLFQLSSTYSLLLYWSYLYTPQLPWSVNPQIQQSVMISNYSLVYFLLSDLTAFWVGPSWLYAIDPLWSFRLDWVNTPNTMTDLSPLLINGSISSGRLLCPYLNCPFKAGMAVLSDSNSDTNTG